MAKKKQLTPQEKKSHSLARDRRNVYGNNDKAARTGVRRKRALKNRKYRHNVRQAIVNTADAPDTTEDAVGTIRRKEWRKWPDAPLGELVKRKLKSRRSAS